MLESVYKSYRKRAEEVNWKEFNQNELFFKYIEHENDELAEPFFSGIVCRYWGYSARIWTQCSKHIPFEECYDCVIDSIKYVLKNRVWEKPTSSLYNDPTGPDKAMHIAMKRQKAIMLSKYSAKRRLSNFNTLSLDSAREDFKDSTDGLFLGKYLINDDMRIFISEYFDNDDYFNGLILDTICYGNIIYSNKNIIKFIKNLKENDLEYYNSSYNIDLRKLRKLINSIKRSESNYLEIKINSLLYKLKKEGLFNA